MTSKVDRRYDPTDSGTKDTAIQSRNIIRSLAPRSNPCQTVLKNATRAVRKSVTLLAYGVYDIYQEYPVCKAITECRRRGTL